MNPEFPITAHIVAIDYTNHRGERGERLILPRRIYFATARWHRCPQWLLDAWDILKEDDRTFAMKDIHSWRPADTTHQSEPQSEPPEPDAPAS